LIGETLLI